MSSIYDQFVKSIGSLPVYTYEEVKSHSLITDCWVILSNVFEGVDQSLVIDVTSFIYKHPGGIHIMRPYLGQDCTDEFLKYHVEGHSDLYEIVMRLTIGVALN